MKLLLQQVIGAYDSYIQDQWKEDLNKFDENVSKINDKIIRGSNRGYKEIYITIGTHVKDDEKIESHYEYKVSCEHSINQIKNKLRKYYKSEGFYVKTRNTRYGSQVLTVSWIGKYKWLGGKL